MARLRTELEDKEHSLHTQEASVLLLILLILPEQRGHPDGGEAEDRTGGQGAEPSHSGGKSFSFNLTNLTGSERTSRRWRG